MRISLSLIMLLLLGSVYAQKNLGDFEKIISKKNQVLEIKTTHGLVRLEVCTPKIIRVRSSWNGDFEAEELYMVVKYDWPKVDWKVNNAPGEVTLSTNELDLKINKAPFALTFYDKNGNLLSSEKYGDRPLGASTENDTVSTTKRLLPDEHFFGFGERMDFLDRRGKELTLTVGRGQGRPHIIGAYDVLQANYSPVPFFMSTAGYGIFFHTPFTSTWDMGHSNPETYSFAAAGGELDYYFMYGPDFYSILDAYTSITGKSPMLPKYALGLHVGTYSGGTWGYEELTSDEYPVALTEKFREMEIPIDILHLDSTWRIFGKNGGSGATTFEWRETFENPKAMFDSLYALDLSMVGVHVRPRFDNGNTLDLLDQAREAGYVYPEPNDSGEFVNFFDQKAVDWWWENGAMRLAQLGAMFFKTDEGSAFGRKANESDKTGPQGDEIKRLHNLFPLAYAKAPFEKFAEYNNQRGMNHTREGYAGIQRYPFIFAGDWPSEWQYFEPVIKAGLNIGMSGVSNWAHCMGGFEHVADPELYTRWTQFGLMSPIAHLFGMEHPNYKEPWNYGEDALASFKKYDELRYSLVPYLYSYMYENHQTGAPLMRALVLDYQDDPNVFEISDQYLFGKDLMICPVVTKGAQTRTVYLPEGEWIDFWTNERLSGKQYLNVVTPLDVMPIYVKAGAIIPRQEVMQSIGTHVPKTLTIHLYPGASGEMHLYDDDGKSMDYQDQEYALTKINMEILSGQTRVTISKPTGNYKIDDRQYQIKIHASDLEDISLNGKSYKGTQENGLTIIDVPHTEGETQIIFGN